MASAAVQSLGATLAAPDSSYFLDTKTHVPRKNLSLKPQVSGRRVSLRVATRKIGPQTTETGTQQVLMLRNSRETDSPRKRGAFFEKAATSSILFSSFLVSPSLAEESASDTAQQVVEKASEAAVQSPGWLAPLLLGFPILAYAGFNIFRAKVNPQATLLDFLFLLVAAFIILNVVTTLTLGVRLY